MTRNDESKQPGKTSLVSAGDMNPANAAIAQFRAPAVGEAVDGTLDPADCPDGAYVVTGNDIRTGVGDSVTLTWQGTTVDGQAAAPYTQTKTIASSEVNKPVKFDPVPLAQITALAGGKVDVSYTVTTSGGTKTGASLVNTLQVQKQDNPQVPTQFYAPAVTEANGDGTLDPADCPDGAHVVTGNDIETGAGDSVTLTWQGTTVDGQAAAPYTQTKTIASSEVNKPVKFDPVPLARITALAGGKVDVSYTVTTSGGTKTGASLVNTLQVRKQDKPQVPTQFYAPAVTEANGDGTLDPADCPDGAHVVTGHDIETGVGDEVTVIWQGTTADGQAAAPYTHTKTIASSKVNKPVKFDPVPLAQITALAGGTVDVSYIVTTSGGTKTGASLVNALQVRKQDKPQVPTQFYAPAVTEANGDGTLDPADCPDGAHVVTGNDIRTGVGDSVTLTWQGTTADAQAAAPYTQTKTIASSEVNKPVKFDPVPLAQITALAGGTVDVSYTVTTSGGTKTGASLVNTLQVQKQDNPQVPTQFYAPAVTEANGDGTLDPADCPDGAHVVTGNDIETGAGDSVTLTWQGTTVDGQAAAPYTQTKTIASSKVNKPVKFDPVPLARITALAGGKVDVSYTVTTSGGTKTGASLVNTLQVQKQDKPQVPTQFYAPAVTEANGDGTLDPADCPDGAHVVTGNDIETGVGDEVTVIWQGTTADGQAAAPYTQTKTIASSKVNKPVKFDPVPLAQITALAGGTVDVSYIVTTSGGTKTGASLVNALQVQKQDKPQVPTQFYAPAVTEANGDGTLDPADCPDGAHVVTGNDIETGVGDEVTLTWQGITVDGQAEAPYTQTKTIASSKVNKPVKFDPVPLVQITALAGGTVDVSYIVTTSGGTKTGASLVNALQVRKQDKPQVPTQFYAPAVTEANGDGTLDPADCPDGAHVVTGNDIETGVGDEVTVIWQGTTAYGQAAAPYTQAKTIASSEVNKPVKFDPVPLAQITALAGGTVDVSYIVTASGGAKRGFSLVNTLQVRKQDKPQVPTQFYAPAVTEANGDGTLDPADCPDGAHVVTGNDIRTNVGDEVTLTWQGTTADAQAATPYTQAKTIASSEVNKPVKFDPVPLARITALAGGKVDVSYTVTTSGGTKTGASLVNTLPVRKQDKPATFRVRGSRGKVLGNPASLVAVDLVTGLPLMAKWQYQGDSTHVMAERLIDSHSERILTVTANGGVVRVAPVSIAAYFGGVADFMFVAVRLDDGTLASWSYEYDSLIPKNFLPTDLAAANNFVTVFSTDGAFAALRGDGSVVAWGDSRYGGIVPPEIAALRNIVSISAADDTFVALSDDGSVVAWGGSSLPSNIGGRRDIVNIYAGSSSFVALCRDRSVVAWGHDDSGGIVPPEIAALRDIVSISATRQAFSALRSDGSVVAWGGYGGSVPPAIATRQDIVSIAGSYANFMALCGDRGAVSWGASGPNNTMPQNVATLRDIVSITASVSAFAVLRPDGSVVPWGDPSVGGKLPTIVSMPKDVVCVCAGANGFAAFRSDDSVWVWSRSTGVYLKSTSPTLAVYPPYTYHSIADVQTFLCIDEDHRLSVLGGRQNLLGGTYSIPEKVQGRMTWTL